MTAIRAFVVALPMLAVAPALAPADEANKALEDATRRAFGLTMQALQLRIDHGVAR